MDTDNINSGEHWDFYRLDRTMDQLGKVWRYPYKRHWIDVVNSLPEKQRLKFVDDTLLAPHGVGGGVEVELMRRMMVTQLNLKKWGDFRTNLALVREYMSIFAEADLDFDSFVLENELYSRRREALDQHDLEAEKWRWLSIPVSRPYFG